MKAMILAAGRGARLRPLTNDTPKVLLKAGARCLIEYHLKRLRAAGIKDIVINLGHLGEMIRKKLGKGSDYNAKITYSDEMAGALETGGGIINALEWLGGEPFVVINGDIFTDYAIRPLQLENAQAHLVMVDNPEHNPGGDFYLDDKHITADSGKLLTFSGISYYKPSFFDNASPGRAPLVELLKEKIPQNVVTGELHSGVWMDVGTLERLNMLRQQLARENNR